MEVLKVLIEDAGCEGLNEECLERILKLVEENKYPKLDDEEKKELDNELSDQLIKMRITSPTLADRARKVGLEKTASALSGTELAEVGKPTLEEELMPEAPKEVTRPREAVTQKVVVVSKGDKVSLILSLASLILSALVVAVIFGVIKVPNLSLAKQSDLVSIEMQVKSLESGYSMLRSELVKVASLTRNEINILKKRLEVLNVTLATTKEELDMKLKLIDSRLKSLEKAFNDHLAFSRDLARKVNDLEKKEMGLEDEINMLKTIISNKTKSLTLELRKISEKLNSLESRTNMLASELERLNVTVNTKIEKIMKKYEERMLAIENEIKTMNAKLAMLENEVLKLSKLGEYLSQVMKTLKELQTKLKELKAITSEVSTLKEEVKALNETLNKFPAEINALKGQQKDLETKITELKKEVDMLNTKLAALQQSVEEIKMSIKQDVIRLLKSPEVFNTIYDVLLNKYHIDQRIAKLILLNNTAFKIAVENIATSVCLRMMQGSFRGIVITG